jgi:F-type H+-transporting ATPase subunit a
MLAWQAGESAPAGETGAAPQHEQAHGIPELPNLFGVVEGILENNSATRPAVEQFQSTVAKWGFNDPLGTPVTAFENVFFAAIYIAVLSAFFISGYRRLRKSPKEGSLSRRAMFMEIITIFFDDFFSSVLPDKEERRRHLPFVGTLFIYIFVCNTMGLVFLGRAPTANLSFNAGMALLVFLYVHVYCISRSPLGYLKHYPGALPDAKSLGMGPAGYLLVGFLAILFIVIHVAELFIQPVSLALRLYGNILGKDVLLGVFSTLLPVGKYFAIPLHTPFLFLGLLLGTIQALIFSLLTAVYISMWLPHDDHAHEHGAAHEAHSGSPAH